MPMLTLDDLLYAARNPVASAKGTWNEFIGGMTKASNLPPAPVATPTAMPAPPVQKRIMFADAPDRMQPALAGEKKKRRLTPEEELKVTSQGGQLAILNRGY